MNERAVSLAGAAGIENAIERFGGAARARLADGRSMDELVEALGAPDVRPSSAEVMAVAELSGLTAAGAVRVLQLRERLLQLRELSLFFCLFLFLMVCFQVGLACRSTQAFRA